MKEIEFEREVEDKKGFKVRKCKVKGSSERRETRGVMVRGKW